MGRVLNSHFTLLFMKRLVLAAFGLAGILSIFDLLANAGDITAHSPRILEPLGQYILLRFPEILNVVLPLACLLATLSLLSQKVVHQEMIAIRSVGLSVYQLIATLLIGGSALAIGHFIILNYVMPQTSYKLHLWAESDYTGAPPEKRQSGQIPNWIASGNTIIKLGRASPDGKTIEDLSIISRDSKGRLKNYLTAERAVYENKAWQLENIRSPDSLTGQVTTRKTVLNLPLKPGFFAKTIDQKNALAISDLKALTEQDIAFEKPAYVYQLWLYQKFSQPFGNIVMIFLAAPLALQLARRQKLLRSQFLIILAGFAYFISERLVLSLGEAGYIPAYLACSAAALFFILLSLWWLVLEEG